MNYHSKPANTLNITVLAIKKNRVLREIRILAGFFASVTNGNADRLRVLAATATMGELDQVVATLKQDFNASDTNVVMAAGVEKILLNNY